MSMRILSEEDVLQKLEETVKKINHVKRIRASKRDIGLANAEKDVWERVLYHIRNGEIITLDDENRLQWHINASYA